MSLATIRSLFIELSGRDDLDADSNAKADVYIRTGSKALDMEGDQDRSIRHFIRNMAADSCRLLVPDCRAIRKIWFRNSDNEWVELEKKGLEELMEDYPELEETDSGTPSVWAREVVHLDPAHQASSPAMNTMGVIFMPPTDEAIELRVYGKFYEKSLVDNEDINYWSEEHPMLLVYAALRELEVSYRNTQGYNDWDNRIKKYLFDMDKDLVESGLAYEPEMEG